jgi:integrase
MMLTDAVDERLIPFNPVRQRRRRGRRSRHLQPERVWATPEQVLRIAAQATALAGQTAGTLIITAAWTGCRSGELAGLHRANLHLDHGHLIIDPYLGALHESAHHRWLGPPKTAASARTITLPPFLIDLLRQHLAGHDHDFVFTTASGTWLWRSTFARRVLRPAVDGNLHLPHPPVRTHPIRPGLTLHGLRHSHKTWLIAAGIPEIAQARRLGHHLNNRIVEVYSHVAPEIEQRLLDDLQHRWQTALTAITTHPTPTPQPTTQPKRNPPEPGQRDGADPHTVSHRDNPVHQPISDESAPHQAIIGHHRAVILENPPPDSLHNTPVPVHKGQNQDQHNTRHKAVDLHNYRSTPLLILWS